MRFIGLITAEDFLGSAADFPRIPRFAERDCLIADAKTSSMTGIELYKHLIDGMARVPAQTPCDCYPNDVDQNSRLNDGSLLILQAGLMNSI